MVEYRHDPKTGKYWLMEVNGRFWGACRLRYIAGPSSRGNSIATVYWVIRPCETPPDGSPRTLPGARNTAPVHGPLQGESTNYKPSRLSPKMAHRGHSNGIHKQAQQGTMEGADSMMSVMKRVNSAALLVSPYSVR